MLLLVGVVVLLGTLFLILYEACWILRLGQRLTRAAATAQPTGRAGEGGGPEEQGGGAR